MSTVLPSIAVTIPAQTPLGLERTMQYLPIMFASSLCFGGCPERVGTLRASPRLASVGPRPCNPREIRFRRQGQPYHKSLFGQAQKITHRYTSRNYLR